MSTPESTLSPLPSSESMADGVTLALPAHYYHDAAIYERERQTIFAREWIYVGIEEHVREPGQYFTSEPAQFPIVVQRGDDGTLRGFHNVCRHRASALLTEEHGICKEFVCPYHAWRYRQDGTLRAVPDFGETPDFSRDNYSLFPIQVATWRGAVFANLDVNAPPLDEVMAPVEARVSALEDGERVFYDEKRFEVECNWKTYIDNYQEGYHVPPLHPLLKRDLKWQQYRVDNVEKGSIHSCPSAEGAGQPGVFGWLFPNFTFITYGAQVSYMRVEPLSPTRMCLVYDYFRPVDMDPEEFQKDVDYGVSVSKEDQWITPLIQKNLNAGIYEAGPLSPKHENGVHYFHELVKSAVDG